MFARLILVIAIVTSLMAGPVSLSATCGTGEIAKRCDCCMVPSLVTCCEGPSMPVHRTPASSQNANQGQLKLAIQPIVAVLPVRLCVKPPVVNMPAREIGRAPVSPLIDRTCVRLI